MSTRATCLLYFGVFDIHHMDLAACNFVAFTSTFVARRAQAVTSRGCISTAFGRVWYVFLS